MSFETGQELQLVDSPLLGSRVVFDLDEGFIIDEELEQLCERSEESPSSELTKLYLDFKRECTELRCWGRPVPPSRKIRKQRARRLVFGDYRQLARLEYNEKNK